MWREIKRHLRIIGVLMKLSYQAQMEYRSNFFMGVAVESAYFLIKLSYLLVIVRAGVQLAGLTPHMVGIFVGIYCFMTGVWMMLGGVNSIAWRVRGGTLDSMIVQPISLLYVLSFSNLNVATALPNMGAGIALIVWGWQGAGLAATFISIGGFVLFMFLGCLLTYGLCLLPALASFWVTDVNSLYVLFAALWDFNNLPMVIYRRTVQNIGTFLVPFFILTNWPGLFILKRLPWYNALWGVLVTAAILILTNVLWGKGMKRYTSVNG